MSLMIENVPTISHTQEWYGQINYLMIQHSVQEIDLFAMIEKACSKCITTLLQLSQGSSWSASMHQKRCREMDVQECFQVPPAELVPHQPFEKLLPLINLHDRSLLGLFLYHCSCFVLGQGVALFAMCFWYFLYLTF